MKKMLLLTSFALIISASFLVSRHLADSDQRKVLAMCSGPPVSQETEFGIAIKSVISEILNEQKPDDLVDSDGPIALDFSSRTKLVFREAPAEEGDRLLEVGQYQVCAVLALSELEEREKLERTIEYTERLRSSLDQAKADKEIARREVLEACVASLLEERYSSAIFSGRASARAPSPGLSGGRKRDTDVVRVFVPASHPIIGTVSFVEHICFGGRCKRAEVSRTENDDGSTTISVPIETWSESKSFGGGGKYELEMRVEAFTGEAEKLRIQAQLECSND